MLRSPLPIVLGMLGAAIPLMVMGSDAADRGGDSGVGAFTVLSALVWAAVGVLFGAERRVLRFIVVASTAAVGLALYAASAPSQDMIHYRAILTSAASLFEAAASTAVFVSYRRLLEAREGSSLHDLRKGEPWLTGAVSLAVVGSLMALAGRPLGWPLTASVVALGISVVVAARGWRAGRGILQVVEQAGATLHHDAGGEVIHDLGVGSALWLAEGGSSGPYRDAASPAMVLGSLDAARSAVAHHRYRVVAALLVTAAAGAHVLVGVAPEATRCVAGVPIPSAPNHVRQGSWYPSQKPILVDIDADGVEDVVSLRWDSSNEDRALFVTAHDGAALRARWSSDPIASQWMSPGTHLLVSDEVVFLSDSEGLLHRFDLETGIRLNPPLPVKMSGAPCATPDAPGRIWFPVDSALRSSPHGSSRGDGQEIGVVGTSVSRARPAWCVDDDPPELGKHDYHCDGALGDYLAGRGSVRILTAEQSNNEHGIAQALDDIDDPLIGFHPKSCAVRWQRSVRFDDHELHARPSLRHLLHGERVFGLYQLASGRWKLGMLSAVTGETAWKLDLPDALRGTNFQDMFASKTRLYVAMDWRLLVLDPDKGTLLGSL